MRTDWIESKWKPKEAGVYLVISCKGKVMLDRWDGETWGRCNLRNNIKGTHPGYRDHLAWTTVPSVPIEYRGGGE